MDLPCARHGDLWIQRIWYVLLAHYNDVIMGVMVSQIISLAIVYSTVYSGADQRKHQSSASLAFVREIHQRPVNFPHKLQCNLDIYIYIYIYIYILFFKIYRWKCPIHFVRAVIIRYDLCCVIICCNVRMECWYPWSVKCFMFPNL